MKLVLIFYFFFLTVQSYSQDDIYFTNKTDSIVSVFGEVFKPKIDNTQGEYASIKKKFYKTQLKVLTEYANDSNYIHSPKVSEKIAEIIKNIIDSNPKLQNIKFNYFIDKSYIPNAAIFGDGLMTIHLGLLDFLDSDDEIAFVICHEFSHQLNNDLETSLKKGLDKFYSKEAKEKVKTIKKQRYGQTRAGIELLKELNYDIYGYSRDVEYKADEMGFDLLKNTKYNPNASVTALQKLGQLEEIIFNEPINLETIFDFENYKFKKSWITKEQSLFDTEDPIDDYNFDKDSLRSHPFPKERVLNLISKKNADTLNIVVNDKIIKEIKNLNQELLFQSMKDFNEFDILIYYLLKNNLDNENSQHYKELGLTFIDIYKAKLHHKLGRGIRSANPFSKEEKLDQITLFLSQTELYDIANIGLNYAEKYKSKLDDKTHETIINYFKPLIK